MRKYVPELPDFGTPITIQHLLTHTSGLRSQWPMLELAGRPATQAVHTNEEIVELVSGYTELNFKPGDEYLYNNTAFTLLGVIVSRVSGKSLNRLHAGAAVHPAGDAQHAVAGRFHGHRRGPRHGLSPGSPAASSGRSCRSPT